MKKSQLKKIIREEIQKEYTDLENIARDKNNPPLFPIDFLLGELEELPTLDLPNTDKKAVWLDDVRDLIHHYLVDKDIPQF